MLGGGGKRKKKKEKFNPNIWMEFVTNLLGPLVPECLS
jgi:hypothetical protein